MIERLLTTAEAAARLHIGKHTLEVWRMRGEGPVYRKVGGRLVRYAEADLDGFLTDAERGGAIRVGASKERALESGEAI